MPKGGQKVEAWMQKNKRGFTGIEIILFVAVCGIAAYFSAPAVGKAVNGMFGGGGNRQKQSHKVTEQYSMFYRDDKGNFKPAPVPYKRIEESLNYVNAEPPETLWQKFTKLGAMAVAIIALLSYLGIAPIIALWWSKKVKPKIDSLKEELENTKATHAELQDEAKMIVASVDDGLETMNTSITTAQTLASSATDPSVKDKQIAIAQALTDAKADFLGAMSKRQDSTTKDLVKELLKND
jgi:Tfp pilus assembly protein FimT